MPPEAAKTNRRRPFGGQVQMLLRSPRLSKEPNDGESAMGSKVNVWFRPKNSNMRNHVLGGRGRNFASEVYGSLPKGLRNECEVEVGSDVIC
ncbi:MAG: hypothetical protein ACTS45_01705 [Candidatus Hodgkinia cicadicola]